MEFIRNVLSLREGRVATLLTFGGIVGAFIFSRIPLTNKFGTLLVIASAMVSVYGGDLLSRVVMVVRAHMREDNGGEDE